MYALYVTPLIPPALGRWLNRFFIFLQLPLLCYCDPELGIGKNAAWQTPIYREAVRMALGASS